ncbi:hypothetical protein DZG01_12135 [Pseudomonas fluorescens]|nr:hypothetical protein DZG01_12135 [Pseudomonas fluorescens]BBH33839.1 rhizopine catabolism regulatory protein MocR [Pseudomonas sp. St290]
MIALLRERADETFASPAPVGAVVIDGFTFSQRRLPGFRRFAGTVGVLRESAQIMLFRELVARGFIPSPQVNETFASPETYRVRNSADVQTRD